VNVPLTDRHEPLALRERQGSDDDRIHDRKNRGEDAHTEREDQ
jgi:hypothetical protein